MENLDKVVSSTLPTYGEIIVPVSLPFPKDYDDAVSRRARGKA